MGYVKCNCECGMRIHQKSLAKHLETLNHQRRLELIGKGIEIEDGTYERHAQLQRCYVERNKEAVLIRNKVYKEKNKNKIAEQRQEHNQMRVLCDCGCEVVRNNLSTHKKSLKHLKWESQASTP